MRKILDRFLEQMNEEHAAALVCPECNKRGKFAFRGFLDGGQAYQVAGCTGCARSWPVKVPAALVVAATENVQKGDELLVDYQGEPRRISADDVTDETVVAEVDGESDVKVRKANILGRFLVGA